MRRTIALAHDAYPDEPGVDTGISHAVAQAVGDGHAPETFRLHPAGALVAFGRRDTLAPGYREAVGAAVAHGFDAVERLAGGRAAVFHPGTLAFSWAIPSAEPRANVHPRFAELADLMVGAFARLGIDAKVGELPGEYCPGAYSVSAEDRIKVMGVGQRLVRGAAHVGGVVVVRDGERIRRVLKPVYRALELDWDPATAGALEDVAPGLAVTDVMAAIVDELDSRFDLLPGRISPDVVARGRELAPFHVAAARTAVG